MRVKIERFINKEKKGSEMAIKDKIYAGLLASGLAALTHAVPLQKPSSIEDLVSGSAYARQAYAQDFVIPYAKAGVPPVETPTDLTPDKLRDIIKDTSTVTFIYWRWEGYGNNILGDRFFEDFVRDYGSRFDRIMLVEGSDYSTNEMRKIKGVLNEFNPSERKSVHSVPTYSIVFNGEFRIRGPPGPEEEYEKIYEEEYKLFIEEAFFQIKEEKKLLR